VLILPHVQMAQFLILASGGGGSADFIFMAQQRNSHSRAMVRTMRASPNRSRQQPQVPSRAFGACKRNDFILANHPAVLFSSPSLGSTQFSRLSIQRLPSGRNEKLSPYRALSKVDMEMPTSSCCIASVSGTGKNGLPGDQSSRLSLCSSK
jgi:hypothetical protein